MYGWAEMLAPAYNTLAQEFNVVLLRIPSPVLTPELWYRQRAIWLDVCYFEFLLTRNEWSWGQIRKAAGVPCLEYYYTCLFHWFNVFD
jgi:hypothetical protein